MTGRPDLPRDSVPGIDRRHARPEPAGHAGSFFAVIPAAGLSRRFGGCKQLHPVEGKPLLEHVLSAVLAGGADRVVLVTRQAVWTSLATTWGDRLSVTFNDQPGAEMIDSVRQGLAALQSEGGLIEQDSILVCPGDLLRIRAEDVSITFAAHRAARDRIILASHQGRRGHPLVFGGQWLPFIESAACDRGLHALAREHPSQVLSVACPTNSVLYDVDTPDDLHPA